MAEKGKLALVLGILVFFIMPNYIEAQDSSYSSAFDKVMSDRMNKSMGTQSSGSQEKKREGALENAYSYVGKAPTPTQVKAKSKKSSEAKVDKTDFEKAYVEFRKKNKVPDYVGDSAIDTVLKKADASEKEEVVKIVETEKLLHQIYETYHTEKTVDQALGVEGESEVAARANIIAKQSASLLRGSITKLSKTNALVRERKAPVFLASGGRYFNGANTLGDSMGVKELVVSKIRKDVMAAMSTAINTYLRTAQKNTASAKVRTEKQLMAYVKGDTKKAGQQRINAIRGLIQALSKSGGSMDANTAAFLRVEFAKLDKKTVKQLQKQIDDLRKGGGSHEEMTSLNTIYRALDRKTADKSEVERYHFRRGVDPTKLSKNEKAEYLNVMVTDMNYMMKNPDKMSSDMGSGEFLLTETKREAMIQKNANDINATYRKRERDGTLDNNFSGGFRPLVRQHMLNAAERKEYEAAFKAWNAKAMKTFNNPNNAPIDSPTAAQGSPSVTVSTTSSSSPMSNNRENSPFSKSPSFEQAAALNRAIHGEPKGMVNGAPCYDACGGQEGSSNSPSPSTFSPNRYGDNAQSLMTRSVMETRGAMSPADVQRLENSNASFRQQADINRSQFGDPKGMVNGAPCYDGC